MIILCASLHLHVANGEVFTWGCDDDGKLGHGASTGLLNASTKNTANKGSNSAVSEVDKKDSSIPNRVEFLYNKGIQIMQIGCGLFHTAAVGISNGEKRNGDVYCWGLGLGGRLGLGGEKSAELPTLVPGRVYGIAFLF